MAPTNRKGFYSYVGRQANQRGAPIGGRDFYEDEHLQAVGAGGENIEHAEDAEGWTSSRLR